jgi:EmrB/QacA subfamily drug resistance transporter
MARKWWTLIAVSVATFMLLLDITVVNTALPSIGRDLHASFDDLQWVVDAYTLALAAIVLTAGSLADRLGRRAVFAAGLAVFSLSSLSAGLAPSILFLNISRAVEGVGGAVMFAVSLALLAQEFAAGRERGMAMGIYGVTLGASVAVGPLVGGALTDGPGWRWVFFINVPVGTAALMMTFLKVRESRDPSTRRVDWLGLMTLSSGLFLLVLALLRGNDDGWGSTLIVAELVGAAALIGSFVVIEQVVAEPLLPLALFRRRAFTGVQLAAVGVSMTMFAMFLYLTLYLQDYLHLSPLQAGLRYLPITMSMFVTAPIAGALLGRIQARALMAVGLVGTGVGLILMSGLGQNSSWTALLPGFVVAGLAVGLLNPVIADVALSVLPKERSGMAAGVNDTFRQVGVVLGIAVWGAIFLARASTKVGTLLSGTPAAAGGRPRQLVEAFSGDGLTVATHAIPPAARQAVTNATQQGFLSGLNAILTIAGAVTLLGAVLAFWLVREREIERDVQPEVATSAVQQVEYATV